jgi:CcmD family protein
MNPYLFAAYVSTWLIHVAYLTYLFRRYTRLRDQIEELKAKEK